MSDDKTPLEQAVEGALDAFVYAPIGLLFDGPALFPKLVEHGRTQVQTARMFGQFAVQAGQGEAAKQVAKVQDQLMGVLGNLGVLGRPAAAPQPEPAQSPAARSTPKPSPAEPAAPSAPAPDAASLSITDYDLLSASQVVSRLAGLAAAELDVVRRYEQATRARKTILNKIAQLQK